MQYRVKKYKLCIVLLIIVIAFCGIIFILNSNSFEATIVQYDDISGSQAMFYTIETKSGDFIVVDGGTVGNAKYVREVIEKHGNRVSTWILTHPHPDHIGAFNEIYSDPQGIKINNIITIDMDYNLYKENAQAWDDFPTFERFCSLIKDENNIQYVHTGDVLNLHGFKMKVYNAYDDTTILYTKDLANQGSIVFKLCGKKESILFTSDVNGEVFSNKIIEQFGKELRADYLQMGHHGNWSITKEFATIVQPTAAFFDAPEWLMDDEKYDTKKNIRMMEDMNAIIYTFHTTPNTVIIH